MSTIEDRIRKLLALARSFRTSGAQYLSPIVRGGVQRRGSLV
jgi:hypothetical protein